MSGAFGYEMDLGKCTAEEKMEIRRQVESYKIYYDLLHDGDYYRLSSPFQDGIYTAWEHVSANRREALVSVVYVSRQPLANLKADRFCTTGR